MPAHRKSAQPTKLIQEWQLSAAATLGSAVRAKGILLEVRARLPLTARKLLHLEGGSLALRVSEDAERDVEAIAAIVSKTFEHIETLPVIPREIEDILTITAAERHRWLKDGRLQSAGTRTVKLRGRTRKITFHVFDPHHVEDVLDRDLTTVWREDDAMVAAENRRRAAGKAALTRARKNRQKEAFASTARKDDEAPPKLDSWDDFALDGLLR